MTKTATLAIGLGLLAGCGGTAPDPITITNGQGEMAGEVTADSVILQSRLTTGDGLVDGDVPGAPGTRGSSWPSLTISPTRLRRRGSTRCPSGTTS